MHQNSSPVDMAPDSPEEAVLLLAMQIGKRMRLRHPGDEVDAATIPILHVLTCTGPIRLSDLAHRLHLDASTVSRHARQLEERGLVARTDDPDDRRAARIDITKLGSKVLSGCFDARKQRLAQALASWSTEDRHTLQHVATRFVADLNATDDPATA
jgi:DNA-binding MarR family transcriptional regulator